MLIVSNWWRQRLQSNESRLHILSLAAEIIAKVKISRQKTCEFWHSAAISHEWIGRRKKQNFEDKAQANSKVKPKQHKNINNTAEKKSVSVEEWKSRRRSSERPSQYENCNTQRPNLMTKTRFLFCTWFLYFRGSPRDADVVLHCWRIFKITMSRNICYMLSPYEMKCWEIIYLDVDVDWRHTSPFCWSRDQKKFPFFDRVVCHQIMP